MALQTSGPISASDINIELGKLGTDFFDINSTEVRDLAGVPSGPISFSDFYGKSSFSFSTELSMRITYVSRFGVNYGNAIATSSSGEFKTYALALAPSGSTPHLSGGMSLTSAAYAAAYVSAWNSGKISFTLKGSRWNYTFNQKNLGDLKQRSPTSQTVTFVDQKQTTKTNPALKLYLAWLKDNKGTARGVLVHS